MNVPRVLAICSTLVMQLTVLVAGSAGADGFAFEWKADSRLADDESSARVNRPRVIELLDRSVPVPDLNAGHTLLREHGVLLSDEGLAWDAGHAHAVLTALQGLQPRAGGRDAASADTKWILVAQRLPDDIEVTRESHASIVRISLDAFSHAVPRAARIDGREGRLHSRRLHHAVVRLLTDDGRALDVVERILVDRYGVSLSVADYEALTRSTTGETAASFQRFHPSELLEILRQLEELPPALLRTPEPIYLVRRLDGTRHPLYPRAPAVSWPTSSTGYIEFMEHAFNGGLLEHTQRLVLHEKAHFLWARVLSEGFKSRWIEVADWQRDEATASGWSCGRTTEFVSAHAHARNPVEDMAESLAYFVISPDKLRSRSPQKYELIRDAVLESNIYLSEIREDLTFRVDNAEPDFVYPGRLQVVRVQVDGAQNEDKVVTVEIELASTGALDLAQGARLRLTSGGGTFVDMRLKPIGADGEPSSRLRGRVVLSKYAKSGYWWPGQIVISDAHGNERFEAPANYGWRMLVDNPLEDLVAPRYVPESAWLDLEPHAERQGRPVQVVTASWSVDEERGMLDDARACHATLVNREGGARSFAGYGRVDGSTGDCVVEFLLTEFAASGIYVLSEIRMADQAGNLDRVRFLQDGAEEPPAVVVATSTPDGRPPSLDLDTIAISSRPVRPEAPDGETLVTLVYHVRDDGAGLGRMSFNLRDPQGVDHLRYHYHENFHGPFYTGDPTVWTRYETELLLPEGSAPGVWGLASMRLYDKVGNRRDSDFTETLRFEVLD
jgi:hypothetical protein